MALQTAHLLLLTREAAEVAIDGATAVEGRDYDGVQGCSVIKEGN